MQLHIRRHKDNISCYSIRDCCVQLFVLLSYTDNTGVYYFAIVTVLLYHPSLMQVETNFVFVFLKIIF